MAFTEQQISDCLAELRCQSRDGRTIDGIYWRPLEAIAGPSAFRVIFLLCDRGLLRAETLPGCYSHTIHHFA